MKLIGVRSETKENGLCGRVLVFYYMCFQLSLGDSSQLQSQLLNGQSNSKPEQEVYQHSRHAWQCRILPSIGKRNTYVIGTFLLLWIFLSKWDQTYLISLESARFFSEQFLFPQDMNCCGKVVNGTGCCRSGKENTMVSWMLRPITSIFNIALELWCVSHLSGSTVVQILRSSLSCFSCLSLGKCWECMSQWAWMAIMMWVLKCSFWVCKEQPFCQIAWWQL